jgi:hypothetical protein
LTKEPEKYIVVLIFILTRYLVLLSYLEGKKIIPANIADLLTIHSLGYWIADDGHFDKNCHTVTLNTYCFSLEETKLLAGVLNTKWNLNCRVYSHRDAYVINISSKSLNGLQELLKDIVPSMMLYKIGL